MIATKIPGANMSLMAPRDWDAERDGECGELAIRAEEQSGGALTLASAWKPSLEELALLKRGSAVILTVWSRQHPAVALGVSARPIA